MYFRLCGCLSALLADNRRAARVLGEAQDNEGGCFFAPGNSEVRLADMSRSSDSSNFDARSKVLAATDIVQLIGQTEAVHESFYAISVERKVKHPGIVAITEGARRELFHW